jgi:hypothetical protein
MEKVVDHATKSFFRKQIVSYSVPAFSRKLSTSTFAAFRAD